MGANTAGVTALLDDGSAAVLYAAIGDGPTAADQVSTNRVLIAWSDAADAGLEASGLPYNFSGPDSAAATHLLIFSASSGGTFYGFCELDGDQAFNAAGQFRITELTLTASGSLAPAQPYQSGVDVGVPTGTTLTNRTSLGSPTGSGVETIRHPITGESVDLDVSIWDGFRFTQTFTISPPPGETYLFTNCLWDVEGTAWTVEVDQANGVADQMAPVAVFRRCSFQGNGDSNIGLAANFSWVVACDIEGMTAATPASGASDGMQGAAYSVITGSNIVAGTNANDVDPHSDGLQNTGTGHITLYRCWLSAGASAGANAALRVGTEDGAVASVDVYHCTLDDGGYAAQFRGDAGGGAGITAVRFVGNRFTRTAVYGAVDFENTTVTTWSDNAYLDDGEVIPSPV